jgi:hypothetical protein
MQWILIMMIFGSDNNNASIGMTAVSGFLTYNSCVATGTAWEKTQKNYGRFYECLPVDQK